MKTFHKVAAAIVCLMPLSVVGAATAGETDSRERGERQKQTRMIMVDGSADRGARHERMQEARGERLREHFAQFDLNQNGYITQAELTEVMVNQARERAERMFQRLDTDGTGVVSVERFAEMQGEVHSDRQIEIRRRAVNMRELSAEDRERIREARAMGAEARREGRVIHGDAVEVSVDEEGNRVIRVRNKRADERGNN